MENWRTAANQCIYKCSGDFKQPLKNSVCFSDVFGRLGDNNTMDYEIYVALFDNGSASNFCTPDEVKYVLNKLKTIFPFSFKLDFTPHKYRDKNYGVIKLHINGPKIIHKIILTYTRCFFEYPCNIAAKETLNVYPEIIRRLKIGKSISWFNVYLTIESCCIERGGGHTFTCPYQPDVPIFTKNEIVERVYQHKNLSLNELFGYGKMRMSQGDYCKFPVNMKEFTDKANIEQRIQCYVNLLKTKLKWRQ